MIFRADHNTTGDLLTCSELTIFCYYITIKNLKPHFFPYRKSNIKLWSEQNEILESLIVLPSIQAALN